MSRFPNTSYLLKQPHLYKEGRAARRLQIVSKLEPPEFD